MANFLLHLVIHVAFLPKAVPTAIGFLRTVPPNFLPAKGCQLGGFLQNYLKNIFCCYNNNKTKNSESARNVTKIRHQSFHASECLLCK